MLELLKSLAYKWCEDYGDKNHKTWHSDNSKYSSWCPNCADGLNFARDVVRAVKERLT